MRRQIRYGDDGASAARTLSLVLPCAELVDDGRQGAAVDLSLGSEFRDVTPSAGVNDALRALSRGAESGTPVPGTDPAAHADIAAEIDAGLAQGIDGFFTDFPLYGAQARDRLRAGVK